MRDHAGAFSLSLFSRSLSLKLMQVVLESARESYAAEIVQELESNSADDMNSNTERVAEWYRCWLANNSPPQQDV